MASGRGNFIASSASIIATDVAVALKKEREEKAASASVVSIQDVEDTDDKETKAELARLRAEHNSQIATDAAQAVSQRLEFIRRHTDLLLHFSSKAPTASSKSGFSGGGRKGAGRMSEKEEVVFFANNFGETKASAHTFLFSGREACLICPKRRLE